MTVKRILLISLLFFSLGCPAAAQPAGPAPISRNPFLQTALAEMTTTASSSQSSETPVPEPQEAQEEKALKAVEAGADLKLRAVIVGSRQAMANINGQLIRPGESIQGYRLMRVTASQAVLQKDGVQLTLDMESH